MTIDLEAIFRRRKPEKKLRLTPRQKQTIKNVADAPRGPVPLVLDTNVYIADAAGLLPPNVEALLDRAVAFHCTVCLAELSAGLANSDPSHPAWLAARDHYTELMAAIPDARIIVPDRQTWIDAGVLVGIIARTRGLRQHHRADMFNDALIFLTAARIGLPVLTANWRDFDLLQQLAPDGGFYTF